MNERENIRRAWLALLAVALLAAACGSTEVSEVSADAAASDESAELEAGSEETAETSEADTTQEEEEGEEDAEPMEDSTPGPEAVDLLSLPAGTAEFDVLGGFQIDLPEAAQVMLGSDCVFIEVPGHAETSPFGPSVIIAEIAFAGISEQTPLNTIDDWLSMYEPEPAPVATGETRNLFGIEFEEFDIEGSFTDGPPPPATTLNCSAQEGVISQGWFLPSVFGRAYAAEVDGHLLMVSSGGFTEEEHQLAVDFFEQAAPTIDLNS